MREVLRVVKSQLSYIAPVIVLIGWPISFLLTGFIWSIFRDLEVQLTGFEISIVGFERSPRFYAIFVILLVSFLSMLLISAVSVRRTKLYLDALDDAPGDEFYDKSWQVTVKESAKLFPVYLLITITLLVSYAGLLSLSVIRPWIFLVATYLIAAINTKTFLWPALVETSKIRLVSLKTSFTLTTGATVKMVYKLFNLMMLSMGAYLFIYFIFIFPVSGLQNNESPTLVGDMAIANFSSIFPLPVLVAIVLATVTTLSMMVVFASILSVLLAEELQNKKQTAPVSIFGNNKLSAWLESRLPETES